MIMEAMDLKIKKERSGKREVLQSGRQPGIDLVRVTGLLFVVGIHHFLYNGFYYETQDNALVWAADTFRWLFYCCNGIFMVLTGYLKSTKKFTKEYYKSLVPLLVSYVLCCFIIFPVQSRLITEELVFEDWMEKLFGFGNYAWYVEMYIGLVLISPIINLAMEHITNEKHLIWLALLMLCVTGLPSATTLTLAPDYWASMYPLTYYILGAVIRRLQPKVKVWQGLGAALLVAMGLAVVSVMTAENGFSSGFRQGYGGFWTTLVTVFVFLGLYRVQPGKWLSRALAWMAGGVYEGYMLTLLPDLWLYGKFSQWHTPEKYPLLFLCVTIPIFLFGILSGKLVHSISAGIVERLPGFRREKAKV